ncbi:MAG: response regulator [Candidatus Zhuqueibacterota bacterium]
MKQRRVFIIDDDTATLELLKNVFEGENYFVVIDEGKKDVCGRIKKCEPDIILLDLLMPENNGLEIYKELRQDPACVSIPVVVLTSHQNFNSKIELLREGVLDYIYKPFRKQELLYRVKNYIAYCSPGQKTITDDELLFNQLKEILSHRNVVWIEPNVDKTSLNGYVYPDVQIVMNHSAPSRERELLEKWVSDGKMQKHLVDVIELCPVCSHYTVSLRNVCPQCHSVNFSRNNVGKMQPEQSDRTLREAPSFECNECRTAFESPSIGCHCLNCNEKFGHEKIIAQRIYKYKIVDNAADAVAEPEKAQDEQVLAQGLSRPKRVDQLPESIGLQPECLIVDCIPKAFAQAQVDYIGYPQLKEHLSKLIKNAAPDGTNITVMSLGIEKLESYYRRYNAEIMVRLFKNIIAVIRSHVRNFDVLSYSADQKHILLLLPNTHLTLAKIIADRIQSRLSRIQSTFQLEIQLASYPQDGRNADEILTMMEMGIEKINSDVIV